MRMTTKENIIYETDSEEGQNRVKLFRKCLSWWIFEAYKHMIAHYFSLGVPTRLYASFVCVIFLHLAQINAFLFFVI